MQYLYKSIKGGNTKLVNEKIKSKKELKKFKLIGTIGKKEKKDNK